MTPRDAPARSPSLEDVLLESARLHAMRASILRLQAESARRGPPRLVRRLLHGRMSHRLRYAVLVARRMTESLLDDGAAGTIERVRNRLSPESGDGPKRPSRSTERSIARSIAAAKRMPLDVPAVRKPDQAGEKPRPEYEVYRAPISVPAGRCLRHRVLIVAELSIPQCAKYRVWQKKEHFERLGIPCEVVAWQRVPEVLSLLQTHTLAIFYRVPGYEGPLEVIVEARRLGVETLWEVDDLIFDVDLYGANANLRDLSRSIRHELLTGAANYRRGMLACDRAIGSTSVLAALMAEATGKPSHVVNNALDAETLAFAAWAVAGSKRDPARVVIVYGSGTLTHDTDFAEASVALLRLMSENSSVHLRIIGSLNLPRRFDAFADRIERIKGTNFKAYLATLASADISLAPLENTTFNDAKSNIKLIEASIVGLPSVCSPRREFRDAIEHGADGFLADTPDDWYEALRALVDDPLLRREIGSRSRARTLSAYAPQSVAERAVRPLEALVPARVGHGLRVLAVNIFFSPQSFGGATVVAEEMASRLGARDDTEMFVFAAHNFPWPQYTLRRYQACNSHVIGVSIPNTGDEILNFDDPEMARAFADVLTAVEPDVVHFHSIQHFGAGIVRACQRAGIPYVVTVHDAWWLCARQFMVKGDNTYCYQTTIDLKVCERCMPHTHHLQSRMDILMQALQGATSIVSPSASHGELYRANGVADDKLIVNRNGVRLPRRERPTRSPGPLRFGYVGGNAALKGSELIRQAFASLDRDDWVLVLVDNTLNLGFPSLQPDEWKLDGTVRIVPAYRRETMDAFFESVDVLMFPSQWKESYGLTVREALVRDVWVIATESGGAAEEVVPGVNGTLVPMGLDPAPLARAIEEILEAPERLESYVNPHKATIATLDAQARELHAILRAASVGGRTVVEQQDQQDHDEQKDAEAAAAPAAGYRPGAVVAAVPASPVAGVTETAECGDQEKDQQDVEQHGGAPVWLARKAQ